MKKYFGNYVADSLRSALPPASPAVAIAKQVQQLQGVSEWSIQLREQRRRREIVAGGDILWKPVDSTARKVIAPAPWWAKPPAITHPLPPLAPKPKSIKPKTNVMPESSPLPPAPEPVTPPAQEAPNEHQNEAMEEWKVLWDIQKMSLELREQEAEILGKLKAHSQILGGFKSIAQEAEQATLMLSMFSERVDKKLNEIRLTRMACTSEYTMIADGLQKLDDTLKSIRPNLPVFREALNLFQQFLKMEEAFKRRGIPFPTLNLKP